MINNNINHVSFILDGNKRWAKKNNLNHKEGYEEGINKIFEVIKYCYVKEIKYISLFLLSTENIDRKNNNFFFKLAENSFNNFIHRIGEIGNIKINIIGEKSKLPKNILKLFDNIDLKTKKNAKMTLNLAFNYGFVDELKNAISRILNYSLEKKIKINKINFDKFFYLYKQPNPDILIRTGGNKRLSNFILMNLIYTEIYFVDTLWPDLKLSELDKIFLDFKKINRNYGL